MDMKKILQAVDGASSKKPAEGSNDMRKFMQIVEGKGPLNRLTAAESVAMRSAEKKKTITNPVLNVKEDAKPSMIGKYFKTIQEELLEAEEKNKDRARQIAERVIERVTRDKKKEQKQGYEKHKGKQLAETATKWAIDPHTLKWQNGKEASNEEIKSWWNSLSQLEYDKWWDERENAGDNKGPWSYSSGNDKFNYNDEKVQNLLKSLDHGRKVDLDGGRSYQHQVHQSLVDPDWKNPTGGLDMRDPEAIRRSHAARIKTQDFQNKSAEEKAGWDAIVAQQIADAEKYQKRQSVSEGSGTAKYKVRSIGSDSRGEYYISPSTGEKIYKSGVKVGDHENPKTGEIKPKLGEQGAAEGLEDPKDNPCWKGYKPVGTKKKGGKTVPNCVPKESVQKKGPAGQLKGKDKVDVKGTVIGSKEKSQKGLRNKLVGGGAS